MTVPTAFRDMLTSDHFYYGIELLSTRGVPPLGPDMRPVDENWRLMNDAEALAADEHFSWASITDNPGGNPMLPADRIARFLKERGQEVVIHLSCKDLNRNGLESAAWRALTEEVEHILALSGDYPTTGFGEGAKPVFDLDSVGLITLLQAINDGMQLQTPSGAVTELHKPDFYIGCAVSPFKRHECEYMPQYMKLARKIQCGVRWVIPQLGYDMRKFQELQLFLEWVGLHVPLVGNVYLLSLPVARAFNRNRIPGCVVTDRLFAEVEKQARSEDKGRVFFREFAAKQLAVFKGLGYAAGHVAGPATPHVFAEIIDLAESFGEDDWKDFAREIQYPFPDEFFLFERDPDTGLSAAGRFHKSYVATLQSPKRTANVTWNYRFSRRLHSAVFAEGQGQFDRLNRMYRSLDEADSSGKKAMARGLHQVERAVKWALYRCGDCGDCSLPDIAYLCPQSACAKSMRNGPCGGSFDGMCEVDDWQCIWGRAYDRAKYFGESQTLLDGKPVIYNPTLDGTSGVRNMLLGRSHRKGDAPQLIPEPLPTRDPRTRASTARDKR